LGPHLAGASTGLDDLSGVAVWRSWFLLDGNCEHAWSNKRINHVGQAGLNDAPAELEQARTNTVV
jgi:hypothetical protein